MNRREFLKHVSALLALSAVGVQIFKDDADDELEIEIVDCEIDSEIFAQCLKLGKVTVSRGDDGSQIWGMNCEFDIKRALDNTYLIDSTGKRWHFREIERMVEGSA